MITLQKALPAGTDYLLEPFAKAAEAHHMSPYLLLGICYAESNFGLALKPHGPAGSGDYIPRPSTPDRDAKMAKSPLPGVEKKMVDSIKSRKIMEPVMAWVPTTTGWGCGLLQFDYEAHFDFCASGAWKDPQKIAENACKLLKSNVATLHKLCPGLQGRDMWKAAIAAYNAGAGRVAKAVKAGQSLDSVTFHPGYVDKITKKADELAGATDAWMPPAV